MAKVTTTAHGDLPCSLSWRMEARDRINNRIKLTKSRESTNTRRILRRTFIELDSPARSPIIESCS